MALKISVSGATPVEKGIWKVSLQPSDVRQLGLGPERLGGVSVLGAQRPEFDPQTRVLSVRPTDISVLHVGTSDDAIVIDLGIGDTVGPRTPTSVAAAIQPEMTSPTRRTGDHAFIEECRRHLDERLVEMAQTLLKQVRWQFSGEMREGQARKWVNFPDNFLAMTIQNRDKSFAIYVRGRPQDFAATTIDIREDRPGYSRFKLQKHEQLSEAIDIVLASVQNH